MLSLFTEGATKAQRFNNLLKVVQLVSIGVRIQTQVICLQSPAFDH